MKMKYKIIGFFVFLLIMFILISAFITVIKIMIQGFLIGFFSASLLWGYVWLNRKLNKKK